MRHPISRAVATFAISAGMIPGVALAQWYQGPSGGPGGQAFDGWQASGNKTDIREITVDIYKSDNSISCILTSYPGTTTSSKPGCAYSSGNTFRHASTSLDPDEYVIGIAGQYTDRITQLRFYTNKKNSLVYGAGGGRAFGYTAPSGQMIVAFIGQGDTHLRSIGVMYARCTPGKACK